ncbi:hypothetical protein [uncultured Clostridium sp.]|uniref:hypothetical protein n=1 Tax=uncultured Clostridium sp. TaxID=59620 RepID=UPI0028EF9269|nr:hypothetical protein [uncultured Clostridium sp.]
MENKKSLALFFSLIPGAGHLYLGLQKKGLQIMVAFFGLIALSDWIHLSVIGMFIPIIWFYSVFDVRKAIYNPQNYEDNLNLSFDFINVKYLGYIFIIIGIMAIFRNVIFPLTHIYIDWKITRYIRTSIVSLILIAVGVKMLLDNKKLN